MSDFDHSPGREHLPRTKRSQADGSGGPNPAATPGKRTRVQGLPAAGPGHAAAEHGAAPRVSAPAAPAGAGGPAAPAAVASGSPAAAHRWAVIATPPRLDLLVTEIGAVSPPSTATLTNHGDDPADVAMEVVLYGGAAAPALPGEFEIVDHRPRTLRPRESMTVEVAFRPQRVVPHIGARLRARGQGHDDRTDVRLHAIPAPPRADHADQRELSVAEHEARRLEVTAAPSVQRYGDMLAAVLAAQRLTDRAPHGAHAHAQVAQLLEPVARRLDQLNDHQGRLARFGAGHIAGQTALDMSQAALRSWLQRLQLGARIDTSQLVTRFRVGAEPIRFLTGERTDAPTLRAFDHASRLTATGAAALVLAPAVLAVAAEEAPLLAFAGRIASTRVTVWAFSHPAAALAASEALLGLGIQVGESGWGPFWDQLRDPVGRWFVIAQVLMDYMHVKSGMGHAGPADPPPRSPSTSAGLDPAPGAAPEAVPSPVGARVRLARLQAVVQAVHDGAAASDDATHTPDTTSGPRSPTPGRDAGPQERRLASMDDATAAPAPPATVRAPAVARDLGLRPETIDALRSFESVKADPVGEVNSEPNHNHYAAARREAHGEVVARRPQDGRPYSHIGDLQRAYDALLNIRAALQREIARPAATMTERGLETLLLKEAEVERLLNRLGGFLNEIGFGQFPPYHSFPRGV
jgi:hypothetical protein